MGQYDSVLGRGRSGDGEGCTEMHSGHEEVIEVFAPLPKVAYFCFHLGRRQLHNAIAMGKR